MNMHRSTRVALAMRFWVTAVILVGVLGPVQAAPPAPPPVTAQTSAEPAESPATPGTVPTAAGFPAWQIGKGWTVPLSDDQARVRAALCQSAQGVVIGEVGQIDAEWRRFSFGLVVVSRVHVEVDRTVFGPEMREVVVSMMGGTVGGIRVTSSDSPEMEVGARYLLLLAAAKDSSVSSDGPYDLRQSPTPVEEDVAIGPGGPLPFGEPDKNADVASVIVGGDQGAIRLDPDAALPPQSELQSIWHQVCDAQ